MKKLILLSFSIALLTIACKKNSTPNRTLNRLNKGPWQIAKFIDSTENRTNDYAGWVFDFLEMKELSIVTDIADTFPSTWDVPENETKPARLIIKTPADSAVLPLFDDWYVVYLSREEFRLERQDGVRDTTDELIFRKI